MLRLGYPFRVRVACAALLALAVLLLVLPLSRGTTWTSALAVVLAALVAIVIRTVQRNRSREQSNRLLACLGATTCDLPVSLRTRMPLLLVMGDSLAQLFNRGGVEERFSHVGDGAIWLRIDNPRDLPRIGVAVKQWRDGRAPDGIVLSIAPAVHDGEDALIQTLRVARQVASDASRLLGTRLPAYLAVYQRLTASAAKLQWYGVSSASRLNGTRRFDAVMQGAESHARHAGNDPVPTARAAALASIIDWTQRVVTGPITNALQPAAPWALFGIAWIDCGPASNPRSPWARDVHVRSHVMPPAMDASPEPWPLPQHVIEAIPRRLWRSPRVAALAHAIALLAGAGALSVWGAARNNQALLTHIETHLVRFFTIPAEHDSARRDALQALVADRDQIDRYARLGVPLPLSFGMYRGAAVAPVLNAAINSYKAPPPPPTVITLDSMSLFDSGKAQLRPGSTRAMVGALDMINAHPDKRVLVAGYTDNVGNPESNLKLSIARAEAVRDWLIDASGIPMTQFATQGYGDTRPISENSTDAGRAKNRRVDITLVPDPPTSVPIGDTPASQVSVLGRDIRPDKSSSTRTGHEYEAFCSSDLKRGFGALAVRESNTDASCSQTEGER